MTVMTSVQYQKPTAVGQISTDATRRHFRPPPAPTASGLIQRKSSCACGGGCPRCQEPSSHALQTKLAISTPGDTYEREADRIAEQVTSVAGPVAQRSCAACAAGESHCTKCESEPTISIQRQVAPASAPSGSAGTDGFIPATGSGQPLSSIIRSDMESRFGHDFGHVRVHTDSWANESARAINAQAYTVGRDIVFRAADYAPETAAGRRLLAHELTHVLQQTGGGLSRLSRAGQDASSTRPAIMRAMGPPLDPDPKDPYKEKPKEKEAPEPCKTPPGAEGTRQPVEVSQKLLDRMMGKYASKDGDPGEGCEPLPYPAAPGESVCSIGFGHQIKGCGILVKATGASITSLPQEERMKLTRKDMSCACGSTPTFDCKGPEAEGVLKKDAANKASHVNDVVPVTLNQDEFDAIVDLALHHGSVPKDFIETIKKYWCSNEGKNYVREIYLKTLLKPQGSKKDNEGFIKRRQLRVWPKYE